MKKIINGDVTLHKLHLKELPKLADVILNGDFECFDNYGIKSLEGVPKEVIGDFSISHANLENLFGSPRIVRGNFAVFWSELKTIEGAPDETEEFSVTMNSLTSIEPMSKMHIYSSIDVSENRLASLRGSPDSVDGNFYCNDNPLLTLKYGPNLVEGAFNCSYCKLTSLEGAPEKVGEDFSCSNNQLTSLEGAPKEVGGSFYCSNNARKFTEAEVRAVCNVKGRVHV